MIWTMLILVCIAGAIGGLFNALLVDHGLVAPTKESKGNQKIYNPGYLGNVLCGALAAGISWGLYGPFSSYLILSISNDYKATEFPGIGLTVSSLVGAALVGVGGAQWLTNEASKKVFKNLASIAASAEPSPERSREISVASAGRAVEIAEELQRPND
jgi:hypothetical protein